jgi:hypothetical protein
MRTDSFMEAVRIPETSIYFNKITRRCIPEACYLLHNLFVPLSLEEA